jgi:hypothetical protein
MPSPPSCITATAIVQGQANHQKPTATRVAGIHTWNKLGRIVNEGEKGIIILAPVFKKEREETRIPPIPGNSAPKKDDARRLAGSRTAFVYERGANAR